MKKILTSSLVFLLALNLSAQIKVHSDNHISLGSLTKTWGIQMQPSGFTYFQPSIYDDYAWLNMTIAQSSVSKCFIVSYNNVHKFFVYGNGQIYSGGNWIGSDSSLKTNIRPIVGALSKVLRLRGVSYDLKPDSISSPNSEGISEGITSDMPIDSDSGSSSQYVSDEVLAILESEKSRQYLGLIAQEVEPVIPEVVRTVPDGTQAVSYQSIVPLLIEALKEQQDRLDSISDILAKYFSQYSPTVNSLDPGNAKNTKAGEWDCSSQIYQNTPNPFSTVTTINFSICPGASEGIIYIFNLQGGLLKSFAHLEAGNGSVSINGAELKPGIYLYSMFVDGLEIDTKRMVLTE